MLPRVPGSVNDTAGSWASGGSHPLSPNEETPSLNSEGRWSPGDLQPRVTVLEVADPQLDCEQLCSRARAVCPCPIPYRPDRPRGG